MSSAVTVGMSH